MSKKMVIVEAETLKNLLDCFSNAEEYQTYIESLVGLITEFTFSRAFQERADTQDEVDNQTIKQVFMMAIFFRENYDLIQNLVRVVDYKHATEEEAQEFIKNQDTFEG